MDEAKASWNTMYLDQNGFECQITLRDEDEKTLAERVAQVTRRILESGGKPGRRSRNGYEQNGQSGTNGNNIGTSREKTYVDPRGIRRCNLLLTSGSRCNEPVTEKEGRYGRFWSCPHYRDHAPPSR